jgi:hypothetical protein
VPRPYRVDPQLAHDRAILAAQSRTGPDYHLRKLAGLLPSLTGEQQRRLAELALAALAPEAATAGDGAA